MRPLRSLLLLFSALLPAYPALAQGPGQPLAPAQVACEEGQLGRLVHRMAVSYDGSNLFLWRATPLGGLFGGLSTTSRLLPDPATGLPTREEEQIAFDLLLKPAADFLDPRRLLLPQATLVRRDAASNLSSAPPAAEILDASLDLAPAVPNPIQPTMPIRITDRRADGAGQSDRAARSLAADALLDACHAEVSGFDLKVYSILARTLRVSDCLLQPISHCDGGRFRFKSVFFRGAEPLTYRVNVFSYSVSCDDAGHCFYGEGQVALLLRVQVDAVGRLAGGDLQALPWCTSADSTGCTSLTDPNFAVFLLPPLRPGLDRQSAADFARAARLNLEFNGSANNVLKAPVNWPDLLRGSSWNAGSGDSP